MGRARRLVGGTPSTGLGVEYVRTRKVVRLLGWMGGTPIEPIEIPVDQLCRTLGISPHDLGIPQQFLLFAGSQRQPAGGLRDLVGTFDIEERAWAAFRDLRQAHPATQGWAELATIDGLGHVNQLAWFGLHPASEPGDDRPAAGEVGGRGRLRSLHRPVARARATEAGGYLRAITPS